MANSRKKQGGSAVQEPTPPFAKKHLEKTGLESELEPRPRFDAARYKAAGKLEGKGRAGHRRRLGNRTRLAVLYAREGGGRRSHLSARQERD